MAVARAGLAEDPPVEPPRALRSILRFRRLPASALEVVLRALDEDDAFRRRVLEASADEGAARLDPASKLVLERPTGWEAELAALEAAASSEAAAAATEAEERSARRRLRSVEEAAARAEEALVRVRAELAAVTSELAAERRARREAEERTAAVADRVRGLEHERDAAHRRSAALATEVRRLEAAAAGAVAMAKPGEPDGGAGSEAPGVAAVGAGGPVAEPASAARPVPQPQTQPDPRPDPQPDPQTQRQPEEPSVAPAASPFDVEAVRRAVADAGRAAAALGASLAAAAAALGAGASGGDGGVGQRTPASPPARSAPRPRVPARRPAPLPPAVYDDEPAAAAHLVRVPGCVLVVDGYNASLRRWPDQPIAEQRRRLADALGGLSARTGIDVHLLFDGAGDAVGRLPATPRGRVRVLFTPADVEADDAIVELVTRLPADRVVVVATDDRRVRAESAARGANVIGQDQLFSLL